MNNDKSRYEKNRCPRDKNLGENGVSREDKLRNYEALREVAERKTTKKIRKQKEKWIGGSFRSKCLIRTCLNGQR